MNSINTLNNLEAKGIAIETKIHEQQNKRYYDKRYQNCFTVTNVEETATLTRFFITYDKGRTEWINSGVIDYNVRMGQYLPDINQ